MASTTTGVTLDVNPEDDPCGTMDLNITGGSAPYVVSIWAPCVLEPLLGRLWADQFILQDVDQPGQLDGSDEYDVIHHQPSFGRRAVL